MSTRNAASDSLFCIHGHELTPSNVYIHPRSGHRRCRECMAASHALAAERRKQGTQKPREYKQGHIPKSQHGVAEKWKERPKDPPAVRARSLVQAIATLQKKKNSDPKLLAQYRRDIHGLLREAYGVKVTRATLLPYMEQGEQHG